MSHTPGPWIADKIEDRNAYNVFPAGATHALVTVAAPVCDGAHPYGQAAEANARLIAAAPALLAALQALVAEYEPNLKAFALNAPRKAKWAQARDAIAAATVDSRL